MKTKLLIYGITGDLSTRKLLPALRQVVTSGQTDDLQIIGVSRHDVDIDELLQRSLGDTSLRERTSIISMDLAEPDEYRTLKQQLDLRDDEQLIVYLSVPPSAATRIVDFMGEAGINTPNVKILFEKPFGVDYDSAVEVVERTARYYEEEQIYRIDHYLAKEMAQNLVAFRGGNALFSQLWDGQFIESIDVVASETIGIEGRAQFYEQTGALRDVVQGHLMQLLALTLMDIPPDFSWDKLPELRLAALQSLEPADPTTACRAQYEGYQREADNPGSLTETFVSLTLRSTDKRWQDIPIRLTTGKALSSKTTEVRVHLRKTREAQSNRLTFNIQPDEGIHIELFTKKPGYDREFETRTLGFDYPEDVNLPDAYEQVLVDAIRSQKSLFTSSEEVQQSWKLLQPVQDAWNMDNEPLQPYQPGASIDEILQSDVGV